MGKIADDMIDGDCCAICGAYFFIEDKDTGHDMIYSHGMPVACNDCWTPDCGYEKQDKKATS